MPKKSIEINECAREQCQILRKQLFEANNQIQELNKGNNISDYEESGGLHDNGDGTAMLYPVGIQKYIRAMANTTDGLQVLKLRMDRLINIKYFEKNPPGIVVKLFEILENQIKEAQK